MSIITAAEYQDIMAREAEHNRLRNGRGSISATEYANWPASAQLTNEERSKAEVYQFVTDPPTKYVLYVKQNEAADSPGVGSWRYAPLCTVTTWTGETLGSGQLGRRYDNNIGGYRRSICFAGINGCQYYGTYYESSGDYAIVTMCKADRVRLGKA
jgi:hypothetical protein